MADPIYIVAATKAEWAEFDAKHPNQDAQTGDPYRRRRATANLPYLNIADELVDAPLEERQYSCALVLLDDGYGDTYIPAIAIDPIATRGFTTRG